MRKTKRIVAKNAGQLAEALGLTRADGLELDRKLARQQPRNKGVAYPMAASLGSR
jgi:hypothetical protein